MEYLEIPLQEITRLKSLWKVLNQTHLEDSPYFRQHYQKLTFEARIQQFSQMKGENIKIFCFGKSSNIEAYCISTIKEDVGEIESICVFEEMRKMGVGKNLIESSKKWFRGRECKKVIVSVSYGHDSVLPFYEKLGFWPRLTILELIDE